MSALFLKNFFLELRLSDLSIYKKLHSEIRSIAPLDASIMIGVSHLSSDQLRRIRTIFLDYDLPESAIASPTEIEEAYRLFYADYIHSAPK